MDTSTVRCLLLWSFALHIVDSYPRKYTESELIHSKAKANPKSRLLGSLHSESDHVLPEATEVKKYNEESYIERDLIIFLKQLSIKLNPEKILQHGAWHPQNGSSKNKLEKTRGHVRERRSIGNSVSPSSNDQHLTTVSDNPQHELSLASDIQDESSLEHDNQNEAEAETDDDPNTDIPNSTLTTLTIDNQHLADLELDIHQPTESIDQHEPYTQLHQHHSDLQDDDEEMEDQNVDDIENENLNPTVVTNDGHHQPNFLNNTEQTPDPENNDINDMILNPTVDMNNDHQVGNGNEEVTEQENDSIEDLNPTTHTNPETNQNHLRVETPNPEHAGVHQLETTSESSLPNGQPLDINVNNEGHIENGASPDDDDENSNIGGTSMGEGADRDMAPNGGAPGPDNGHNSENSIVNGEDTIMRTTRTAVRARGTTHTNSHENPMVNDPVNDDISSNNIGNHDMINGNPAPVENEDNDGTGQRDNTSLTIDNNVPSIHHPASGAKINQTNDTVNMTLLIEATVKTDTNQTNVTNPTRSVPTNISTSTLLHSSLQPSDNSTSTPGSTSFPSSLQTPVSMSIEIPTTLQTQTTPFPTSDTINYSSSTSTPTSVFPSPMTRFDNLITTSNSHNATSAMVSATNIAPPTEDGQESNATVATVTETMVASTRASGDGSKTTTKVSVEPWTNTTEGIAEPVASSDNLSNVLPTHSRAVPLNPSANRGEHNTTLVPGQVPPLTRPRPTITTLSSPASTASSSSAPSLTSNGNVPAYTQESIPPTMSNGSLLNGSHSAIFEPLTTKLETTNTPRTDGEPKDETTTTTITTSPSTESTSSTTIKARPILKPQCFMELHLSMSWSDFCTQEMSIRGELVELLQQEGGREEVTVDQVQILNRKQEECRAVTLAPNKQIHVQVYLVNKTHHFDRDLTSVFARLLSANSQAGDTSLMQGKLLAVRPCDAFKTSQGDNGNSNSKSGDDTDDSLLNDPGVTIALVIAVVGSCCGVGLIMLQTIIRRRHRNVTSSNGHPVVTNNNRSFSITSADSIQLYTVSKTPGGMINFGLNLMEPPDPTHPLNLTQLSEFCADDHKIFYEYQKLPNRLPRLSVVPKGEEDKNRYANILPLAHTRVKLNKDDSRNSQSTYINANYVTGPNNECQYYIATQAPTTKTINDFWTMVWQQEAKAIVMMTQLEEGGQCKAASYWPELTGKSAAHRHGDFVIELKQKDVSQEYISSRLEVNNLRKIETRQIQHFWYTCWPSHGTPEPISLVKFVLDTRPRFENTGKPLIVHCSPGTGRTGTFIGLDLCMRQFESKRVVDVMKTVHDLRLERAGAIQNKEQYALLYNAINEYASIVASPVVSVSSSASTLHALLPD